VTRLGESTSLKVDASSLGYMIDVTGTEKGYTVHGADNRLVVQFLRLLMHLVLRYLLAGRELVPEIAGFLTPKIKVTDDYTLSIK
jgi:hypothetical protein